MLFRSREVPHFQPYLDSFGYRVEADGKVFAYTSDLNLTLPAAPPALRELVQDADVLVHYFNAFAFEARKGEFAGPRFAGELARDANVKTLVTTHHGPWIDADGTRERMSLPLEISVLDNGPGVSEEMRAHLFDAFVTSKPWGTGLGLALVAKVIRDLRGVVEFESEPRRTIFRVRLPIFQEEGDAAHG